uniref:Methanogenesis marker 2 protein n=1 Tax=Candidatus Methanomethylicus mesodigestus TaxID=1867258 RepID=A0A7C3J4U2_9CREN
MENLSTILQIARDYKGLKRKGEIGEVLKILGETDYDDAGILDIKEDFHIVVSTDGITEDLVKADPWFAGYYSVLVNVNDVVVKGAKPLGYVNVVSGGADTRKKIAEGIKTALDKYDLKLLKGHTHPDTTYEAIDAAVVGIAKRIAKGTDAKPGDKLIMVIDLNGAFGIKGWVKCFDSTLKKSKDALKHMIDTIVTSINDGLVTASRDISAPGILGSLAMLCEASRVGAEIDLTRIPKPKDMPLSEWLISYPAMGFIFASNNDRSLKLFRDAGFSAEVVGAFTKKRVISASLKGENEVFLDLSKTSVFGVN